VSEVKLEAVQPLAFYGTPMQPKIPVRFVKIPLHQLGVSRRGAVYMLKLDVSDMTREKAKEALEQLVKGLDEKFHAKTVYAAAYKNEIYLQVRGSPFAWAAVLAWLPVILAAIGVILFGVAVWQIIAPVPTWVWATLVIGGALVLFGPAIGEWILAEVEKARRRVV